MGTSAGVPGLSKSETKGIITTIMSAIVYSHYMEAINPGSFQNNMNDIYKCNGLKPINFPTPPMTDIVLQSCREVFLGTQESSIEEETDRQTVDNATDKQTNNDELTLKLVDDNVATEEIPKQRQTKRQRESLTPPNKDEKRKKDDRVEITETEITPKKNPCNNEGLPQRHRGDGDARVRTKSRPRNKRGELRSCSFSTSSTVQFGKRTKNLGLKMYMKNSSNFDIISKDPRERNGIRIAAIEGVEVKFTWDSLSTEWEYIINNLKKGTIDLNDVKYQKIDDTKFNNLISSWFGYANIK